MESKIIDINNCMQKISQIEFILNEVKQTLYLDKKFQESINRGEKNISEGEVIVCKTEKELDNFFDTI
ncbi:MAG: hypothetical protein ABFQ65_02870 [Nanoarchaeota archaeon]